MRRKMSGELVGRGETVSPRKEQLIAFLRSVTPGGDVPEQGDLELESLALLQVVAYLESNYGVRLAELEIEPDDLRSVHGILSLIERCA